MPDEEAVAQRIQYRRSRIETVRGFLRRRACAEEIRQHVAVDEQSARLAHHQEITPAGQHHPATPSSPLTRAQPSREPVVVHARKQAWQ